jgi:endoribonuclease Dicer
MTAQIFLNILRHSFLKMASVGLLILDECHHAVKKHPYSLIMQEFYHPAPPEQRPTIFGMTASPVNLKGQALKVFLFFSRWTGEDVICCLCPE